MAKQFHGIPTKHKGRQFRSRLEARWATFFDLVGWEYEYEPFDCNGWIPDFVLKGVQPVAVEVKPVTEFPRDAAEKIEVSGWAGEALILGCCLPVPPADPELSDVRKREVFFRLGWLAEVLDVPTRVHRPRVFIWAGAVLGRWGDASSLGFGHEYGDLADRMTGNYPEEIESGCSFADLATFAWTEAGNRTQWKPPR